MKNRPKTHFAVRLAGFALISLPPVGMYLAAQAGATGWIWALIALTVAGSILAIASG